MEQQFKQVKIDVITHRKMHEHLGWLDLSGQDVPAKQDFVSAAVSEKIDREEAKAAKKAEGAA